ncbi:MAG: hypothetical protein LBJ59_01610 [Zoogloeaceae bacterium]|jgi:hypothetical protein|nr:hypothetical protein [Zoogloeaceae bacterium]
MTDSLSVYRLLSVIDENITPALIAQLLEAVSSERASSLEGVLDAIGDIFKIGDAVQVDDPGYGMGRPVWRDGAGASATH